MPPIIQDRNSYLFPNAACPVCGAPVFFYQSPAGGMVFFDELGPPWPKHPCTSRDSEPKALAVTKQLTNTKWELAGWEPIFISGVINAYKLVLGLQGIYTSNKVELYVSNKCHSDISKISKTSIAYIRQRHDGSFDFSALLPDGKQASTIAYPISKPKLRMTLTYGSID